MSFVIGKKIEERGGFHFEEEGGQEDEQIWNRLKDVFESTYDVLHELAEERGIDVEDIYNSENINREFWGEDYENLANKDSRINQLIEGSDIIRLCLIYENLADRYLEKVFEDLDEYKKDAEEGILKHIDSLLDVINWYMDLIQAKMRRALYGYFYVRKAYEKEDYNGSAKVALLAIDTSVEAWEAMKKYAASCSVEISHLLTILQQLKGDIEKKFPEARQFLRPGFDI